MDLQKLPEDYLKRLEAEGFIYGKQLTAHSQIKYFYLSAKGRVFLKNCSHPNTPNPFISIGKNALQLVHNNFCTESAGNDFYFSYISLSASQPCPWILEPKLPGFFEFQNTPPRSDGCLYCNHFAYYVEQDNGTQSENVLLNKLKNYIHAGFFRSDSKNRLVFCLAFSHRKKSDQKPAFLFINYS